MDSKDGFLIQNTTKGKKIFKILKNNWFVLGIFVTIIIVGGIGLLIWEVSSDSLFAPEEDVSGEIVSTNQSTGVLEESCNVIGIDLHGDLYTYNMSSDFDSEGNLVNDVVASEWVTMAIEDAEENENIKAIILEVDSYGGQPIAGEEIANALKRAKKPTVGLIRSAGLSAAYWAVSGADTIFASKNSDIGGIGATMSYLDYSEKNKKEGITYNSLSTGKFKDAGDPDKSLTAEERILFERDLNIFLNNFILDIANNRKMSIAKVKSLADGSSMLGEQALNNGLIDKLGDIYSVKEFLKEKIGEETNICWE